MFPCFIFNQKRIIYVPGIWERRLIRVGALSFLVPPFHTVFGGVPIATTAKGHLLSTLVTESLWKRTSADLSSTAGNSINEAAVGLKDEPWKFLFANTTECGTFNSKA